jgi:hypothetical protein
MIKTIIEIIKIIIIDKPKDVITDSIPFNVILT